MDAIRSGACACAGGSKKRWPVHQAEHSPRIWLCQIWTLLCNKLGVDKLRQGRCPYGEKAVKRSANQDTECAEMDAGNLSGGNQQKVVVGKMAGKRLTEWLFLMSRQEESMLRAKVEIYNLMNELKKQGIGSYVCIL